MAWLEVHQSLFTHRKTLELAEVLDLPEVYAAAHLIALWAWALDNAPDAVLPRSPRTIARAAQWESDPATFVDALVAVGFLDDVDGEKHIHDWHEYAGRLIEKRKANAARMREARAKYSDDTVDERATHVQRTLDARAGATVPYRTVPNHTSNANALEDVREQEAIDNFSLFAEDFWTQYPARNGKKLNKAKCWEQLKRIPARDWDAVLVGVGHFSRSRQAVEGFAPDAFRWLRDAAWKEWQEPEKPATKGKSNGSQHKPTVLEVLREIYTEGEGDIVEESDNRRLPSGGEDAPFWRGA